MKRSLKKLEPIGATLPPEVLRLVAGGHKVIVGTYDEKNQQCRVDEIRDDPEVSSRP
jgi:hypothetical protein